MNHTLKSVAAIFILLFFWNCGGEEPQESEEDSEAKISEVSTSELRESDLQLKKVMNGTVNSFAPITGRVIPTNSTQLVAEVQGRIQEGTAPFKEGIRFRKGQVILSIDNKEFALNLEAQKNGFLNSLVRMMPDLKADYPDNFQTWNNYIKNFRSDEMLENLPETISEAERFYVTSQQIYHTYYSIKAQEERLKKYTLIAPYDGILSMAAVDVGGLVSPGQTLGTFISNGKYEIETGVNLSLAKNLREGQSIEFSSRDLDQAFMAKIVRINNILDPQTQNIPVFFAINNDELRSGLYLEGRVELNNFEGAFNIPKACIERDNSVHVLENGVIRKRKVKILASDGDTRTVSGLADGTTLILNSFDKPVVGLKISSQL